MIENRYIQMIKKKPVLLNEDIVLEYRKGDVNVDEKTGRWI